MVPNYTADRYNENKVFLVLKIVSILSFLVIVFLWIGVVIRTPHDIYPASEYHETAFTVVVNGREY